MTPRFKVAVQIRLRQLPGTGYNGAVRLRVKQEDKVARCWDAIFCGEERADDKHLAVRQPGNAPKNCVGSQDYRRGELRFELRLHRKHARVKFGRRKWLVVTIGAAGDRALSYSRCIVVQPKFDQCSLSRTKMNRLRQNESQQLECGVFTFRGLVEFRSGWILI